MLALGLLALVLTVSPARCRDAYDRMDLRAATELCQAAIPDASPAQLGELYRLLGASFAALGDEERARAAFGSLLALDSTAELPAGTSPKIKAVLQRARTGGAAVPVEVSGRLKQRPRVQEPIVFDVTAQDGASRPVVRFSLQSPFARVNESRGEGATLLTLPAPEKTGPLELDLRALDRFGGSVARTKLMIEVDERRALRPWYLLWPGWAVGAAAFAGAGVGLGVASRNDGDAAYGDPYAATAEQKLGRAQTEATLANVAFVAGASLAIGALVLLFTEPRSAP